MGIYRGAGRRGGVVAGCLIALGVLLVILVIGGIVVMMNWRSWMASGTETLLNKGIEEMPITEADRTAMKGEVSALMQDFKDKKVTFEQLIKVAEEVGNSPIAPAAGVMFVDEAYIKGSTLTDEEKADGSVQLSRFMRGLFEESISQTKIDDVTEPIHYKEGGSGKPFSIHASNVNIELKDPKDVTPDELKAFLANCRAAADEAGVPQEKYEVNMAAEFSAAIDRALGRAPEIEQPAPAGEGEPGGG